MISLSRTQRAALLFVSASAYLAWFSGYDGRLEAQDLSATPIPTLTIAARPLPPRVASFIQRDPFARGSDDARNHAQSPTDVVAESDQRADDIGTVPNISESSDSTRLAVGADAAGDPDPRGPETLVVRATIVGSTPIAYVANGSTMEIVRVGDRLGERRIVAIDLRGIALADGTRLDLPGAFVATPTPQIPERAVTIKLADLRKLLSSTAGRAPVAAANEPVPPPAPVATPTAVEYPTAGPLPTIDPRGIPVGTNPTPDANGPTPFPIPYPYAPPHR